MVEDSVDYKLGVLTEGIKNIQSIFKEHSDSDLSFQSSISNKLDALIAKKNTEEGKQLGYTKVAMLAASVGGIVTFFIDLIPKIIH